MTAFLRLLERHFESLQICRGLRDPLGVWVLGYVVQIWECRGNLIFKTDPTVGAFLTQFI